MEIVLYTLNCPKCRALELKLEKARLAFSVIDDADEVIAIGKAHGIESAPILEVNGEFYDFSAAIKYINERN